MEDMILQENVLLFACISWTLPAPKLDSLIVYLFVGTKLGFDICENIIELRFGMELYPIYSFH